MLYYWLLFFFVTLGAKLLLALVTIYMLLPTDANCSQCDEQTLLIRANRLGRLGFRVFMGRVHWRWCPRCGWEGLARTGRRPLPPSGVPLKSGTPTRH